MAKKQTYGNESITSLKGADRVRLRPAVIFGSDGLDGCEHSIFEILSNSIDEARQRAMARRLPSPGIWTTPSRWRTTAGASPVDYNKQGAALQLGAGVLRDVRRRQVQQRFRGATMSTPWV